MLGGYCVLGLASSASNIGFYFQRVYINLPAHNYIRFSMNFWAIDSWDLNQGGRDDGFQLSFDGLVLDGWHMSLSSFTYNLCGTMNNAWYEMPRIMVSGLIAHTGSTLTFRVISDLNEESCNESFGFRDLQFVFDQNAPTGSPAVNTICGRGPDSVRLPNKNCDGYSNCALTQYQSGTSCYNCNSLCSSCVPSGSASDCYGCIASSNVIWDGTKCTTCTSPCATCSSSPTNCLTCSSGYLLPWTGTCEVRCQWPLYDCGSNTCCSRCTVSNPQDYYHYWDGTTCLSTCPAPYVAITEYGSLTPELRILKLCTFPCSASEYLYWDGTCQHDCGGPLTIVDTGISGMKKCTWTCTDTAQYLYWDGSCSLTCDAPFLPKLQNNRRICAKPCPLNQYYYWNGDCMDTCGGFLLPVTTQQVRYCNWPCAVDEYLYWNGDCKADCPFPLKTRIEKERKYCDFPTSSIPGNNVLYWDGTFGSSCPAPFSGSNANSQDFCDYSSCQYDYTYWDNSCVGGCAFPLKTRIDKNRQYCDFPCTTAPNTILYWDGTCSDACDYPLTTRTDLGKDFCDFPCDSTQFLYWDKSCSFNCPDPFVQRIENSRKFCDFPCSGTKPYLYENNTCQSGCSGPFSFVLKQNKPYCSFKCPSDTYLYYDGSCKEDCEPPFLAQAWDLEKYCDLFCPTTTGFYYWNHTCGDSCLEPLQTIEVRNQKWCVYPCLRNQFLHLDGSCSETCGLPFSMREESGYKYCENPCLTGGYLYWNGSCGGSCDKPLRQKSGLCLLPCDNPTEFYDMKSGECMRNCDHPSMAMNDSFLICLQTSSSQDDYGSLLDLVLQAPEDPDEYSLGTLSPNLHYLRYLDIQYPKRLHKLAMSQGRSIITLKFGQAMPESMRAVYIKRSMPKIFEERGLHSNFIVNFWSELMSWVIVLIAIMVLHIFEAIASMMNWMRLKNFFEGLIVIFKINILVIVVATGLGDLFFYAAIEFMSLGDGHVSAVSLILCLFSISVMIALVAGILYIVPSFEFSRRKLIMFRSEKDYEGFLVKWTGVQVMFRGFRNHKDPNPYFYVAYIMRVILSMLVSAALSHFPVVQSILYVTFTLLILGYLLIMKPLMRRINLVQLILVEVFTLIVNCSLFILALLDSRIDIIDEFRVYYLLGDVVVCGNGCINISIIVFFGIKISQAIYEIFKYQWRIKKFIPAMWGQLLVFYAQQGGFGFEEMFVDMKTAEILSDSKYMIENEKVRRELESKKLLKGRYRRVTPFDNKANLGSVSPSIVSNTRGSEETLEGGSPIVRYRERSLTNVMLKSPMASGSTSPVSPLKIGQSMLRINEPFEEIVEQITLEESASTKRQRESPRKMERIKNMIMNEYAAAEEKKKGRFTEISEKAVADGSGGAEGGGLLYISRTKADSPLRIHTKFNTNHE